jgi:putative transposase
MVRYRRVRAPGAAYFFTVTLRDRRSDLLAARADFPPDAFRRVRKERPFAVEAIVVLPDHPHAAWRLPDGDADYSGRWSSTHACARAGIVGREWAGKDPEGEFGER